MLCTNIFYFSWSAWFALLFPVSTTRKHQDQTWICLHSYALWKGIVILKENTHVGPVLSHRTTTSWMCCSCWWLWCLNILVPWSRLLTSATGFGKRGRLISARVSTAFFRLTTYFLRSVRYFFNQFLHNINVHIHTCHAFGAWMLPLFDGTFFPFI